MGLEFITDLMVECDECGEMLSGDIVIKVFSYDGTKVLDSYVINIDGYDWNEINEDEYVVCLECHEKEKNEKTNA